MLFSSLEFLVLFLPLTLVVALRRARRWLRSGSGRYPGVGLAAAIALSVLPMNYGSKFRYLQF